MELSAKGYPDASIDLSGVVKIGSSDLALTDVQRESTLRYRDAVVDLVDRTLDETSRLTKHVIAKMLFGVATGRMEKTQQKMERQAEDIAHSPEFCRLLVEVKQRQNRMVQLVAKLKPYANLSRQDFENCAARPE